MKIVISGTEYPGIRSLTLSDLIALEREAGIPQAEVFDLEEKIKGKSPGEIMRTSAGLLYVGIVVWATRRRAGERLSLEQACDVELSELTFLLEPGDAVTAAAQQEAEADPSPARPRKAGSGHPDAPVARPKAATDRAKASKRK